MSLFCVGNYLNNRARFFRSIVCKFDVFDPLSCAENNGIMPHAGV